MNTNMNPIIIVGFGSAGQACYTQLRKSSLTTPIIVYSDESYLPYQHYALNKLFFNKEVENNAILSAIENDQHTLFNFGVEVVEINKNMQYLADSNGDYINYEKLVIATGSQPKIPQVAYTSYEGIFTYRNRLDAEKLAARMVRTRNLVIYGNGLVGVKAAYALRKYNTQVTLISESDTLLSEYIDAEMSQLIINRLRSYGITLKLNCSITKIEGDMSVHTIHTSKEEALACDTLILAHNIMPNAQLAHQASLQVLTGIVVNNFMQSSDENIYAIGECAEYKHQIIRRLLPLQEQASVVATHIYHPEKSIQYQHTMDTTEMQILDLKVISFNSKQYHNQELIYKDSKQGLYRKLLLHDAQLVGAIAMGEWDETQLLESEINAQKTLNISQRLCFNETGSIYHGCFSLRNEKHCA